MKPLIDLNIESISTGYKKNLWLILFYCSCGPYPRLITITIPAVKED
jgi:hypothetical protein